MKELDALSSAYTLPEQNNKFLMMAKVHSVSDIFLAVDTLISIY